MSQRAPDKTIPVTWAVLQCSPQPETYPKKQICIKDALFYYYNLLSFNKSKAKLQNHNPAKIVGYLSVS